MRWWWTLVLVGCVNDPELLDPCTSDGDCAPEHVCHVEEGEADGVCWTCAHGDASCEEPGEHEHEHENEHTGM